MAFEKLFNEIYAIVSLKYFWVPYQEGFVKGESPDWYNAAMDLGMEISQALFQEDGETQKFLDLYLGKRQEEIPESHLARYAGRTYFYNGRLWAVDPPDGTEDCSECMKKTLFRFRSKLEKLNTNYTRFGTNALYLFLHASVVSEAEAWQALGEMRRSQSKKEHRFDLVFLNCIGALYVLDFNGGNVEPIPLPEGALSYMKNETERLRENYLWEDGDAFPG